MSTQETLETEIAAIISNQLMMAVEEITPSTRFKEDLGADSMDMAEIVMEIESKTALALDIHKLHECDTFGALVAGVRAQMSSSGPQQCTHGDLCEWLGHARRDAACTSTSPGRAYVCSRIKGHSGRHVACTSTQHTISTWS